MRLECFNQNSLSNFRSELNGQLDKWNALKVKSVILEEQIRELVSATNRYAKIVFDGYSRQGKLSEIQQDIVRFKTDIHEMIDTLKSNLHDSVKLQPRIFFNQHPELSKKSTKELISTLNKIDVELKDLESNEMIVETFIQQSSVPDKIVHLVRKFLDLLFTKIRLLIRSALFSAYGTRKRIEIAKNEISSLKAQIFLDKNKIKNYRYQIEQIHIRTVGHQSSKKGFFLWKKQYYANQISKLEAKIKKSEEILGKKNCLVEKLEENLEKGRKTRKQFYSIGGELLNIQIPGEDVNLNGMYFSADAFRNSLHNSGAEAYHLTITSPKGSANANFKPMVIKGFAIPRNIDVKAGLQALEQLGAFSGKGNVGGAGWTKVDFDEHTLFMTDGEAEQLIDLGVWKKESGFDVQLHLQDISKLKPADGGTVILTSGNGGVYEMHKKEILAFLMRGMNVMTFNFRGYGESTGIPSERGLNNDMEAAYNYLKTVHNTLDHKILIKGFCLSGGPAAHLAAKHPECNLFLDQTYAHFKVIVQTMAKQMIKQFKEYSKDLGHDDILIDLAAWVSTNMPKLTSFFIDMISPDWKVKNEISNVKGHVGMLMTTEDDMMKFDRQIYDNYQAVVNARIASSASILAMPGKHSVSWVQPYVSPFPIKYSTLEEARTIAQKLRGEYPEIINSTRYLTISKKKLESLALETADKSADLSDKMLLTLVDSVMAVMEYKYKSGLMVDEKVLDDEINYYVDSRISQDEVKDLAKEFLEKAITMQDALVNAFETVMEQVDTKKSTINDVDRAIDDAVMQASEEIRSYLQVYFLNTIKLNYESVINPKISKKVYVGRLQMDAFLKKALLKAPLVP